MIDERDRICDPPPHHDDRPRWPQGLLERIVYTHDTLGPYLQQSREELIASILASPSPDEEAVHWLGIALVWDDYHRKYLRGVRLDVCAERKLIEALKAIAAGQAESGKLSISGETAAALLACYFELADELPYFAP